MASGSGFVGGKSATKEVEFAEKDPTGRYIRYDDILGKGAFKTVYKAFDEVEGIEVAWNLVCIEDVMQMPGQLERLYSEVHLLKALNHDNIIKLFHSWVDHHHKTINMITELFTSGSLRAYRKKHRKVDPKAIKNWATQILRGLLYLHTQNPPVIHRDLKCDNVFVNGNTGQIKIGDLGLAAVMQQPTARSVIGTPEFMAPELYEEEYNELVDIYSFGLCILEMVTCEYPYTECRNQAQIFKKVTSGIKPQSLSKVDDCRVKQFIEKCLLPASSRPSALELLKDPFLSTDASSNGASTRPVKPPHSEHLPMDVDHNDEHPWCQSLELERVSENKEFRLRGERTDDATAAMTLRIAELSGQARIVHFAFYLNSDTATAIAEEMVEQLELSTQEVVVIAEMIDDLIVKLSSERSPSISCSISNNPSSPSSISCSTSNNPDSPSISCSTSNNPNSVCTWVINAGNAAAAAAAAGDHMNRSLGETGKSEISAEYNWGVSEWNKKKRESVVTSWLTCSVDVSMSTISITENEQMEELKMELNAIETQFQQSFQELLRLREEAIENAKGKWMMMTTKKNH